MYDLNSRLYCWKLNFHEFSHSASVGQADSEQFGFEKKIKTSCNPLLTYLKTKFSGLKKFDGDTYGFELNKL